jgi:hypothetical protein
MTWKGYLECPAQYQLYTSHMMTQLIFGQEPNIRPATMIMLPATHVQSKSGVEPYLCLALLCSY